MGHERRDNFPSDNFPSIEPPRPTSRVLIRLGIAVGFVFTSIGRPIPNVARADIAIYTVPGTDLQMMLQGRVTYNPGGTATIKHPRGTLHFGARDIRVHKVPSPESIYARKLRTVTRSNDVDQFLELSKWALHNGMLDQAKSLLSQAWKVDSTHAQLRKLAGLMKYLNRTVSGNVELEKHARELIGGRDMKSDRSRHFTLLHDCDDVEDEVTRKTRAEMRIELLEKVYESYFLTFAMEGEFIKPPSESLVVVLFSQHADFLHMERRLGRSLKQVAGFYLPEENISVFYDSGTTPMYKQLSQLNAGLARAKTEAKRTRAPGAGELIRFANTIKLLVDIERESEDIKTVSHEAVHHLAGNTALFPRGKAFVRWTHEGLASFFESAKLARWNGVGTVDIDRIGYYRVLEGDPERGSLKFIVSDFGFVVETVLGNQMPAYGQAWALTHFLFNRRFDDLMKFYGAIAKMDPELEREKKGDELLRLFDESFGDRTTLELEWRRYMRTLKTDFERWAEEIKS